MYKKFMKPISAEFFFSIDLAYLTCYWLAKNSILPIRYFQDAPFGF